MRNDDIAYLDYAATAAIRPPAVARAMVDYLEGVGATPGRGGHRLAVESGRIALRCRMAVARLLGIPGDPGRVAFMFNATHAINTALYGTLRAGDAVVVTVFDHNAVRRPVHALSHERGVQVRRVDGDAQGRLDMDGLARALDGARLFVINAASNVLGTPLDVAALAALSRAAGVLTLVDTAQAAGHIPFDAAACGVDLVAFTGHKGMLGPQGIGGLWAREGSDVDPLLRGGTGGNSLLLDMPPAWPDHLEAGTQNAPAIAGLLAGVSYVLEQSVDHIGSHARVLKARLREGLAETPGVTVRSPAAPEGAPIVTFTVDAADPNALAARLDREYGVLVRPGLHCAPDAHRLLGTEATGAIRMSLGWASTETDVDRAITAVRAILAGETVAASIP